MIEGRSPPTWMIGGYVKPKTQLMLSLEYQVHPLGFENELFCTKIFDTTIFFRQFEIRNPKITLFCIILIIYGSEKNDRYFIRYHIFFFTIPYTLFFIRTIL